MEKKTFFSQNFKILIFQELDEDHDGFITVCDIERELELQRNSISLKSLKDFQNDREEADNDNENDNGDNDNNTDTDPLLSPSSSSSKKDE